MLNNSIQSSIWSYVLPALTFIIPVILLVVVPGIRARQRRRWIAREQERFQRDPHVGDRCLTRFPNGNLMVVEVSEVLIRSTGAVVVSYPYEGPFGGSGDVRVRVLVEELRWMPPDTLLGPYHETVKETK